MHRYTCIIHTFSICSFIKVSYFNNVLEQKTSSLTDSTKHHFKSRKSLFYYLWNLVWIGDISNNVKTTVEVVSKRIIILHTSEEWILMSWQVLHCIWRSVSIFTVTVRDMWSSSPYCWSKQWNIGRQTDCPKSPSLLVWGLKFEKRSVQCWWASCPSFQVSFWYLVDLSLHPCRILRFQNMII